MLLVKVPFDACFLPRYIADLPLQQQKGIYTQSRSGDLEILSTSKTYHFKKRTYSFICFVVQMYAMLERISPRTRKLELFARMHNTQAGCALFTSSLLKQVFFCCKMLIACFALTFSFAQMAFSG